MNIEINMNKVVDIKPDCIDDVYLISVVFDDNQVLTYAYLNKDEYSKDFLELVTTERGDEC